MSVIKMILTNAFNPDYRVYKEAKYLVSKGYNVEILCWDRENEEKEIDEIDGVKIRRFHINSVYGSGLKQFSSMKKFIKACKNYLKTVKYDFLHCHDIDGAFCGYKINKKANLIFDMHEFYFGKSRLRDFIYKAILNKINKKINHFILVNEHQLNQINKKYHNKVLYLPNYPEAKISSWDKTKCEQLRINFIGCVRDYMSLSNLIKAVGNNDKFSINIYGDGVEYQNLLNLSNEYKNVSVLGHYDGINDTKTIYESTDILYCVFDILVQNWKTGISTKIFEAIITNTPIITNINCAEEEFVSKYNIGWSVDGTNPTEVKNLLLSITPEMLEEKKNNLKNIQNTYIWENAATVLDNIYN